MGDPIVQLSEGKIKGILGKNIDGGTIYKFLGVPYAKPPTGELRFKAPQPVEPWEGIKDATEDGNPCYHMDVIQEKKIIGSEDCLVLNVYTQNIGPTDNLKPVMVYIHGGGFTMGSNKSDIYGPDLLLTEDIVLVAINYRLGLLGFISLEDESLEIPGNAGLKDQTLALKWVQTNIKHFGGDPNNVTIFGESAGGAAVHFLVLSPTSKGLFHKAIIQSGVALCSWALGSSNGANIAEALDKKGATDQEIYNILKNMTGPELFAVQEKILDPMIFGIKRPFVPVVEKPNSTAFITKNPFDLLTSGDYNHVPLFIGYTSHEGLLLAFMKKQAPNIDSIYSYELAIPWFMETTDEQREKVTEIMSNFYSKQKEPDSKYMLLMDSIFLSGTVASIVQHLKTSRHPIYVYRASVEGKRNFLKEPNGLHDISGTAHADELGYLFSVQGLPTIEKNTFEHLTVQRFVKFWTNFARTGNPTPNNDFAVTFAPVEKNKIPLVDIGKDLTFFEDLPERERVDLWKNIFQLSHETVNYL